MFTRMVALVALTLALLLTVGIARADDAKDQRVRKAKAALALAGSVEKAPTPKLALLDYVAGWKLAIEKSEPLIVFCSAPRKDCPKGSVCASAEKLPGYPARCVVVSYPQNGKLIESKTLSENATVAEVLAAFEEAQKKSQAANPKGSEPPEDEWFITADVGEVEFAAEPPKAVAPPKMLPAPQVCTGPECGQGGRLLGPAGCKCGANCPCVNGGLMTAAAAAGFTGIGRPHLFGHVRGFVHRVGGRLFHRR